MASTRDAGARPRERAGGRRVTPTALALGAIVVGCVALLAAAAFVRVPRLSGTNGANPTQDVVTLRGGDRICQPAYVYADTGALEFPYDGSVRPAGLQLSLYTTSGALLVHARSPTLRAGRVRFPLARTVGDDTQTTMCIVSGPGAQATLRGGQGTGLQENGKPATTGQLTFFFLRPGKESLLAMVPVVAKRIGRVRGVLGGPLRAVLIVLLLAAGVALTVVLLRGRLARRVALACAAVAVLNAAAFSLLTPALQIPDEPYHVSYVQGLAVKGQAPRPGDPPAISQELTAVIAASNLDIINFNPAGRPVWDAPTQQRLLTDISTVQDQQRSAGSSPNVRDYPPLYYAAQVPVYAVTHALGGTTLSAITPMRLASALLAGLTVLALLALLRELFPRAGALPVLVALACAYQPVLVWISGGVNPDGALIAAGTALFWLFARGFRRGLDARTAAGLGLALAAAVLVQPRGVGFAPGWALGVALLLWRRPVGSRARVAAWAVAAVALPFCAYEVVNVGVWHRALIPGSFVAAASGAVPAHTSGFASYLWQYFLPPVGSMTNFFHTPWTVKDLWVPMWVGRFGWYEYQFPGLVNHMALFGYALVAVGALVALVPALRRHRSMRALTLVYAVLAAGIVVALARVAYPLRASGNNIFEQARYLMPLVALYALALALAATSLRRRGLAVATLYVAVCVAQLLGAIALTVHRYYL